MRARPAQAGAGGAAPPNLPTQSGVLFLNTLFDENAACHIALGQAHSKCFTRDDLTPAELDAAGANRSLIHVDWMIGLADTDVDGIGFDGSALPVMRQGVWGGVIVQMTCRLGSVARNGAALPAGTHIA